MIQLLPCPSNKPQRKVVAQLGGAHARAWSARAAHSAGKGRRLGEPGLPSHFPVSALRTLGRVQVVGPDARRRRLRHGDAWADAAVRPYKRLPMSRQIQNSYLCRGRFTTVTHVAVGHNGYPCRGRFTHNAVGVRVRRPADPPGNVNPFQPGPRQPRLAGTGYPASVISFRTPRISISYSISSTGGRAKCQRTPWRPAS